MPKSREELEQLPGVGRKTANVILNTAFGEPVIAVDTHVFRISNRTGLANGNTVLEVENKLMTVVPSKWKKAFFHFEGTTVISLFSTSSTVLPFASPVRLEIRKT